MTPKQAYETASQWGSYIKAGDPGACFYAFRLNDGRPVDEAHRSACVAYTRDLIKLVHRDIQKASTKAERTELGGDLAELEHLLSWFKQCGLAG